MPRFVGAAPSCLFQGVGFFLPGIRSPLRRIFFCGKIRGALGAAASCHVQWVG